MVVIRACVHFAFVVFMAVVAIINVACAGNSPTSPTSTGESLVVPAPGTTPHEVTLPSGGQMTVWVKTLRPEKHSRLTVGQTVYMEYTAIGPSGYTVTVTGYYMSGPNSVNTSIPPSRCQLAGIDWFLGPRPNSYAVGTYQVTSSTPAIDRVEFYVWVKPAGGSYPQCATEVFKEDLNLEPPM